MNDKVFILEEVENHQSQSKNFDANYKKPKAKHKYIPPMNHPWRKNMFKLFIKNQNHHMDENTELSA